MSSSRTITRKIGLISSGGTSSSSPRLTSKPSSRATSPTSTRRRETRCSRAHRSKSWSGGPSTRSSTRRAPASRWRLASLEEVFYLPGHIDIVELRRLQKVERAPGGGRLMHKLLVRGHWRRANPSWQDQRNRWIQPYWEGPEMAALVERAYRLRPPATARSRAVALEGRVSPRRERSGRSAGSRSMDK